MIRSGDSAASSTLSALAPPFTLDRRLHPAAAAFYPAAPGDDVGCGRDWPFDVEQRGGGRNEGSSRIGITADHPPSPNTTLLSVLPATHEGHKPTIPASYGKPTSDPWTSPASSCLASFNSSSIPGSDVIGTAPYYPYYNAVATDSLESVPDIKDYEVNGFMRNGRFNGQKGGGPWMDPSSRYKSSVYHKESAATDFSAYEDGSSLCRGKFDNSDEHHMSLQCADWLDGKMSTIFEESTKTSCKIPAVSVYDSSAYLKGMTSPVPAPMTNAYGSSILNSSYNRCITQMDSCSAAPTVYYPSKPCSNLSQEYGSSVKSYVPAEYSNMPAFSSSKQHADLSEIKDGYVDVVPAHLRKLIISRDTEVKEGAEVKKVNFERSRASNNTDQHNSTHIDCNLMINDHSFGTDFLTGNSMERSTGAKSGSLTHLDTPKSFTSGCVSAECNDSMQTFSGTLDHINLAVDSPCWKGASAFRRFPAAVSEMTASHVDLDDLNACNDFGQGVNAEALSSLKEHENLICSEKGKDFSLSSLMTSSLNFSSPCTHQKFDDNNKSESNYVKANSEEKTKCLDMIEERKSADIEHQNNFVSNDFSLKQLGQEGNAFSSDGLISFNNISNHETGHKMEAEDSSSDVPNAICSSVLDVAVPCETLQPPSSFDLLDRYSAPKIDVQLVVKAIHNLSEVLLSTCSFGPTKMKEHDQELLQLAIKNLNAFILKSKEDIVGSASHLSGPKVAQADIKISASDANHAMSKNKYKARGDMKTNTLDNLLNTNQSPTSDREVCDTDFRTNGVAQALEKALKLNALALEDPQILLYKKLWIEAEAALCSMKYELQLVHMKQKIECRVKENTHDILDVASNHALESKGLSCKAKDSMCNDPFTADINSGEGICTEPSNEAPPLKTYKTDEVDASVMARFRILESRINSSTFRNREEEQHMSLVDITSNLKEDLCSPPTENESGIGLKHLTTNPANAGLTEGKSQQFDTRLCHDLSTFGNDSGEEDICTQPNKEAPPLKTYKTDEVDASVMARFRILESRIDGSTSRNFEKETPIKEGLCSPPTERKASAGLKHLTINPENVGFTGGKSQQLHTPDESRDSFSELKGRYELPDRWTNFTKVLGHGLDTSGQVAAWGGSCFPAYCPVISSYVSDCHGMHYVAGGSNSSSSEWEHVQAEEIKW